MVGTLQALKFVFMAPFILGFLTMVNVMTSPGHWWVQWAALGIGIALHGRWRLQSLLDLSSPQKSPRLASHLGAWRVANANVHAPRFVAQRVVR